MKTTSIALFLALSAGYLGAATAASTKDSTVKTGKEAIASDHETSQTPTVSNHTSIATKKHSDKP
ncbi:hypothetical protein [Oceanisphaera ostreae]|uniref:Uncharacterized protein n=1 Tax=Oceanisphaera ostreae TaxID=914151 RepID=A0ABW3KEL7_9GAMM